MLYEWNSQTANPRFRNQKGQDQNCESVWPNYEIDCGRSQSHISKLRIRISQLRREVFRLQLEVLNLEISDYEWTKNSATRSQFARAKTNHETRKLAGGQYAAFVLRNRGSESYVQRDSNKIHFWMPTCQYPSGPEETDWCRGAKFAARQFLSLTCLAITLTAGLILKEDKKTSLMGERQFGRHFRRQFGRG